MDDRLERWAKVIRDKVLRVMKGLTVPDLSVVYSNGVMEETGVLGSENSTG